METPQNENQSQTPEKNNLKKKPAKADKGMQAYAKYSALAFQLGGTIAVGALIGRKLDQYFELDKPLLTALLALIATIGGIYLLVNGLMDKGDK